MSKNDQAAVDFTPLKQAGIGPGIAAKLMSVSRVTVSQWYNGHVQPHSLLQTRVKNFIGLVQSALDQKLLPLPSFPGRKNLLTAISAAIVSANKTTA